MNIEDIFDSASLLAIALTAVLMFGLGYIIGSLHRKIRDHNEKY